MMIFLVLLVTLASLCPCWSYNDQQQLRRELFELQTAINTAKNLIKPKGDQMEPASSIFLTGHWRNFTGDRPIMIGIMHYHFERYGNFIGNYFDDISCAKASGLHYVAVLRRFDKDKSKAAFWYALPTILPHPHPANSYEDAAKIVAKKCKCNRYCWKYDDPMMYNIPFVSNLVRQSVHSHLQQLDEYGIPLFSRPMDLVEGVDIFPRALESPLPLLPDVAIHYRCSDNLYGGMGLLSFGTIQKLVPQDAKTIYIFTEYGHRLKGKPLDKASTHIFHRLFTVLTTSFPNAVVVIKRGGNEATAVSQLALATKVTICSPSTFCFWSAIGRTNKVYFPATSYIAYSREKNAHVEFHEHFSWLRNDVVYKNFTKDTDPQDIIKTLCGDAKGCN